MSFKESSSAPGSWADSTPRGLVADRVRSGRRRLAALALYSGAGLRKPATPGSTIYHGDGDARGGEHDGPTTISIVGTIAARYDMPSVWKGDRGRVATSTSEAGDRVKRGQVLARLNVRYATAVANLEAGLEQAGAEAELGYG